MLQAVQAALDRIDHVVVAINSRRASGTLLQLDSDALTQLLRADLVSHYAAARTFIPALAQGGVYIGIGGGSADFLLEDGIYMSVAQAGLRMLYRGLAHELTQQPVHVRELIIASSSTARALAPKPIRAGSRSWKSVLKWQPCWRALPCMPIPSGASRGATIAAAP